jgi:glycosyltransferase involved in cell wall biosynthesis
MAELEPTVLHVLPHPGGGGETYVKHLVRMDGYRFDTTFVARRPSPSPAALVGGARAQLAGSRYDLLHVHGEVAAALCLPALAFRPSVLTIHGLHFVRRLKGWKEALAEANLRLLVRAASRTICVVEAELAEVESLTGANERLVLVRNGVDPRRPTSIGERDAARAALGLSPSETVGLYLAALDPHKEPGTVARAALDAARRGVPLVLLFAGDGPLRAELEVLDSGSGVLRFLGFQSDVGRVFAAADFFVLPSRREGLSFSLLEAMSAGLAPIVSDVPGNPEAVGDAGIVVREGDVDGFSAAFELLALDRQERDRLAERARERVAERFDSRQMLERTRAVYDEALGAPRVMRKRSDRRP